MVLKPNTASGLTILELLFSMSFSALVVAMALMLFKDVGFAARLGLNRRDTALQAQATFGSMSNILMSGGGILHLSSERLEALNYRNRRMQYRWADSTLTLNDRPLSLRLASLEIIPEGPTRPHWNLSGEDSWELDSLDGDRDGAITFDELDRDRSGDLDPAECRFISRITLRMTTIHKGIESRHTGVIHPRNRVPADIAQEAGIETETEGIPEP